MSLTVLCTVVEFKLYDVSRDSRPVSSSLSSLGAVAPGSSTFVLSSVPVIAQGTLGFAFLPDVNLTMRLFQGMLCYSRFINISTATYILDV